MILLRNLKVKKKNKITPLRNFLKYSVLDFIRESVYNSISYSVIYFVRNSVSDSVYSPVLDSVRDSVYDSVGVPIRRSVCYLIGRSSKDYFKQNE